MRHSIKTGFSFGLTSAVITTLGLMIGLNSGTHSRIAVIGGILTIAMADAMSDALGIHISEESEGVHTTKEVWESTLSTFFFKFTLALTFLVPVLILPIDTAMIVSIMWGLSLLCLLSFYLARNEGENALRVISEHLVIALAVIFLSYYLGVWINGIFG